MGYQPISVREAIRDINGTNGGGWFLPYVQRDYVWGTRYQAEQRILNLLDSLFKGYPVGSLILWSTKADVPFHYFLDELDSDETRLGTTDNGMNGMTRFLVYDGQQRLQTLHSCLKHSFNGKIVVFNLLYDSAADNDTGFSFIDKNSPVPALHVKLNGLFVTSKKKSEFKAELLERIAVPLAPGNAAVFEENLDCLWKAFREEDQKSLVRWVVTETDERKVNEIFMRLNSGGIPLNQSELLLAKLSEGDKNIHDTLGNIVEAIERVTGGFALDSSEILRVVFQLVKGNLRVDVNKTTPAERAELSRIINDDLQKVYVEFYRHFMLEEFRINNAALVPQAYALYPLLVYHYKLREKKGRNYTKLEQANKLAIQQYFILSQLKAWNLQGLVDNASRLIVDQANTIGWAGTFPLSDIIDLVKKTGKREYQLREVDFENNAWFALKVFRKNIQFNFVQRGNSGRMNPELEHVFPKGLHKDDDPTYRDRVNVVWNLDGIPGTINNIKQNIPPKTYFLANPSVYGQYGFLPPLESSEWDDDRTFVQARKKRMLESFDTMYHLAMV